MYPQNYGVTASAPVMPQHGSNEGNAFQSASSSNEDRMRKFQYLVGRYEINQQFAARLRALEGYEIVLILDGKSKSSERNKNNKNWSIPVRIENFRFGIDEHADR